jgi:hypothetical protein
MALKPVLMLFCFCAAALALPGDSVRVYAYSDGFHTLLVLPDTCTACPDSFLEYDYAERAWYLNGQTQWYRVFPALLWNTQGTVGEIRRPDLNLPVSDSNKFSFAVSWAQYAAMRKYIETWIDRGVVLMKEGEEVYYLSRKPYHLFNSCHSFVLKVLKKGGVQVTPWLGLCNSLTVYQLRRAEKARLR